MKRCVLCGGETIKVIYLGFPMRLCVNADCNAIDGLFAPVAGWFPIAVDDEYGAPAFAFMPYDRYWPALWRFLRGA